MVDRSGRLLVIEDDPSGHHLVYVRHLITAALARGWNITFATNRNVVTSTEYAEHLAELVGAVEIVSDAPTSTPADVTALAQRCCASRTVVPDGDALAMAFGVTRRWRGPGVMVALVMRDPRRRGWRGPHAVRSVAKRALLWRARRVRGVFVVSMRSALDPGAGADVALDPVTYVADPATSARLRDEWGIDREVYWFAVIGAITVRKNIPLVADAVAATARTHRDRRIGLLVVGTIDPDAVAETTRALTDLSSRGVSVVCHDALLSDAELDAVVGLADCIVVAHSNDDPSGIMAKGVVAGVNIAAAGAPTLRRDAEHVQGAAWSELDVDAMTAMFQRCIGTTPPAPRRDLGTEQFAARLLDGSPP